MTEIQKLAEAVQKSGLSFRNWSASGDICLAIYTSTDSFLGTISIDRGRLVPDGGKCGWFKRDLCHFRTISRHWEGGAA